MRPVIYRAMIIFVIDQVYVETSFSSNFGFTVLHNGHELLIVLSRRISCPIVGCPERLKSLDNFEDHYKARHTAACSVCSRVYPTSRLLSIHISEAHDSFFQAKVARGYDMVTLLSPCAIINSVLKQRSKCSDCDSYHVIVLYRSL